jgi:hypothetical protein
MFTRAEGGTPRIRRHTTKERDMPQIIVTSDHGAAFGEGAVMLRERVTVADFESDHFAMQLVERLGWAVGDADEVERVAEPMLDQDEPDTSPAEPHTTPAEPIRIPSPA